MTRQDITLSVTASGTLLPRDRRNVMASSQAKVVKLYVGVGSKVNSGQKLAQLDDSTLQNNLKKAQYAYNSAIYGRNEALSAKIQDVNRNKQLQQQVNSAYVDLQAAQKALNDGKYLRSPIKGVVSDVNAFVGNTMSLTTPVFVIQSSNSYFVKLEVNQADIAKIKLDQQVALTFTATQTVKNGKVTKIYPAAIVSATSGVINYYVETSIDDTNGVKPDMTIDAAILISSKKSVLTLPSATLIEKNGKYYVNLVTAPAKSPVLAPAYVETEVTVGINNNTIAEILSGLNEGQEVIIVSSVPTTTQGGFMQQRMQQ